MASQASLAQWCKKHHLPDEARLHWMIVLQLQPDYPEALAAMKLKPFNGVLMTPEQTRSAKKQVQDVSKAVEHWRPLVAPWYAAAERGDAALPADLREKIVKMSEPAEFLGLEQALVKQAGAEHHGKEYHRMLLALAPALGENRHVAAAASLARHILFVDFDDVAAAAAAGLKRRPPDHYMALLLDGLQSPLEVSVKANGSGIEVYQEGVMADYSFSFTRAGSHFSQEASATEKDASGGKNRRAAKASAGDIQGSIRQANAANAKRNARVVSALHRLTGLDLGEEPMKWWKWWWQDYNELFILSGGSGGYYGQPAKTIIHREVKVETIEFVIHNTFWAGPHGAGESPGQGVVVTDGSPPAGMCPFGDQSTVHGWVGGGGWGGPRGGGVSMAAVFPIGTRTSDHTSVTPGSSPACCSGFAPGTKVWALGGRKPIGEIKVGDCVLAQDVETGELAYKPVLGVPMCPPGPRVQISVYPESIVAAPCHPFWSPGDAWRMAKQLTAGNRVHTLSGGLRLDRVEQVGRDVTVSLVVADFNTYFVGDSAILVHDNTPRQPTAAALPGLKK